MYQSFICSWCSWCRTYSLLNISHYFYTAVLAGNIYLDFSLVSFCQQIKHTILKSLFYLTIPFNYKNIKKQIPPLLFPRSLTPLMRSRRGSNQPTLHSQWLSRKVSTGARAASAPFTRDLIRPSRLSLRRIFTFLMIASSWPSEAEEQQYKN